MQTTTLNFIKPISHNNQQTRWVLEEGSKAVAPTIKIIDFLLSPNKDSWWPVLTGCYSSVKSVEIKLRGKRIDFWEAREWLPYQLSAMTQPEEKVGVDSVLYGIGNNVYIDPTSQLLTFNREKVDSKSVQMKLNVFSDLLNQIAVITDKLEIFVNWMQKVEDVVCPIDPTDPADAMDIKANAPYLSYETLIGDQFKQVPNPQWKQLVRDVWTIPAIDGDNVQQQYELRSNAFSGKHVYRCLMANLPSGYKTAADCSLLYQTFGGFMSVPMKQESWNIAMNGRNILSFRNSSNSAIALSIVHDSLAEAYFTSNAHIHSRYSPLLDLKSDGFNLVDGVATPSTKLNGYAAYGGLEIDAKPKELAFSYRRMSDLNASFPSLGSALGIVVVGEVMVALVNGEKVYL